MGEIKNKLNISRITVKDLFLVVLLMVIMGVLSVAVKLIGNKTSQIGLINSVSADTPDVNVGGCDSAGSGGGSGGSESSESGGY